MELVTNRVNILRGVSPAAHNAKKTHCKRGHEFNDENTLILKTSYGQGRQCRKCAEYYRRQAGIMPREIKQFCKNGHAKTPENMYKRRACRICALERENRRNAKFRAEHPDYLALYVIQNKKYKKKHEMS